MRGGAATVVGVLAFAGAVCAVTPALAAFDCNAETKCGEMASCAEAHYKLTVCGHSKRDGDDDGIPCEKICGGDLETYRTRVKAGGGVIDDDEPAAEEETTRDPVSEKPVTDAPDAGVPDLAAPARDAKSRPPPIAAPPAAR